MNRWLGGRKEGWMDSQTAGWGWMDTWRLDGQADGQMDVLDRWMDGWMARRTYTQLGVGWGDGRMGGWAGGQQPAGWMEGWMRWGQRDNGRRGTLAGGQDVPPTCG